MRVEKELKGTELTVWVYERLDTSTAPQLEEELNSSLDGVETLILDLSGLEYVSSAGLRVILGAHKTMMSRGGMTVRGVNSVVAEIFDVTGFSDILNIER